jgi:hypothetical protein
MNSAFLAICAALTLSGCTVSAARIPRENVSSAPLGYTSISKYLESRVQSRDVGRIRYQRDYQGAKLFITFFFRKDTGVVYRTLIVATNSIQEIPAYPYAWYDDDGERVFWVEGAREWYEDHGTSSRFFARFEDANYHFNGGATVRYAEVSGSSGILGVVGTDLVLVRFRDRPDWIATSAKNPRRALVELPRDFQPQAAYASGTNLVMFDTYRPQGEKFLRRCLVYEQSTNGYKPSQEIAIEWAGDVYDMYGKTGDAIIGALNNRHMYPTYRRFNVWTRDKDFLGLVPADNMLFLKDNVIKALDAELQRAGTHESKSRSKGSAGK